MLPDRKPFDFKIGGLYTADDHKAFELQQAQQAQAGRESLEEMRNRLLREAGVQPETLEQVHARLLKETQEAQKRRNAQPAHYAAQHASPVYSQPTPWSNNFSGLFAAGSPQPYQVGYVVRKPTNPHSPVKTSVAGRGRHGK